LDEQLQQIRNNFTTQEAFDQKLKEQNAEFSLLKEETRFQMAVNALIASFDREVPQPSEEEVQQNYTLHSDTYKIPRKIRFSLIMIAHDPDSKPEVLSKNLKVIRQIHSDILARKNTFEFYAKNFSDDQTSRKKGGDMGTLSEIDIKEPFTPVKDLWVGELSQVYSFPKGFYVAKVTEEVAESKISFSEVKSKLRLQLYNQALQNNRDKCIAKMRGLMKIEFR
jgi:parvulin-like peptidyl-prolyl isomerase